MRQTRYRVDLVESKNGKPTGEQANAYVNAREVANELIQRKVGYDPKDTRIMATSPDGKSMVIGAGIDN